MGWDGIGWTSEHSSAIEHRTDMGLTDTLDP